jgi:hypothetical protein
MRLALPILLAVLVFAPTGQAQPKRAQPARSGGEAEAVDRRRVAGLSLTYSQAPGVRCGSEPRFRLALADRLGYSPFGSPSPDHPPIVLPLRRLDVAVTQEKGAVIMTMTGFSADGKPLSAPRSLSSMFFPRTDCEQLIGYWALLAGDVIRSFLPPRPNAPQGIVYVPPPEEATRLEYILGPGTATCPDEEALRDYVAANMGGDDPFTSTGARRIVVTIRRRGAELRAHLALYDEKGQPAGETERRGSTCVGLVGDLGITLSLMIRPLSMPTPTAAAQPDAAPPPSSAPPPSAPPPPRAQPLSPPHREPEARSADGPRPGAGVAVGVDVGTAPKPMVGLSFEGLLRWPDFSLALELQLFGSPEGVGEQDVRAHAWAGLVVPCAHRGFMFACGLAALGVRGFETGYVEGGSRVEPEVRNPFLAAIGLRAGAAFSPGDASRVRIFADLLHTPLPTTLIVDTEEVWVSFPISARLSLGFEQYF